MNELIIFQTNWGIRHHVAIEGFYKIGFQMCDLGIVEFKQFRVIYQSDSHKWMGESEFIEMILTDSHHLRNSLHGVFESLTLDAELHTFLLSGICSLFVILDLEKVREYLKKAVISIGIDNLQIDYTLILDDVVYLNYTRVAIG